MNRFDRSGAKSVNVALPPEVQEIHQDLHEALGQNLPPITLIMPESVIKGDCERVVTKELLNTFQGGQIRIDESEGNWRLGRISTLTREEVPNGSATVYLELKWLAEGTKKGIEEVLTNGPFQESIALKLYDEPASVSDGRLVLVSSVVGNTVTLSRRGDDIIPEAQVIGASF